MALPRTDGTRTFPDLLPGIDVEARPGGLGVEEGGNVFSPPAMPFHPSLDRGRQLDGALRGARRAFALFVGQTEGDAIDAGLLGDVFDLTRRKAEICRDRLLGLAPAEIAEAGGRSARTVRNRIQTIHDKLGVGLKPRSNGPACRVPLREPRARAGRGRRARPTGPVGRLPRGRLTGRAGRSTMPPDR